MIFDLNITIPMYDHMAIDMVRSVKCCFGHRTLELNRNRINCYSHRYTIHPNSYYQVNIPSLCDVNSLRSNKLNNIFDDEITEQYYDIHAHTCTRIYRLFCCFYFVASDISHAFILA